PRAEQGHGRGNKPKARPALLLRQRGGDEAPDLENPQRGGKNEADEGGDADLDVKRVRDRREVQLRQLAPLLQRVERRFQRGERVVVEEPSSDRAQKDAYPCENESPSELLEVI